MGDTMVKALQRWLDAHQLPAIIAAVLGVVLTISVLMVAIGWLMLYLAATRISHDHSLGHPRCPRSQSCQRHQPQLWR